MATKKRRSTAKVELDADTANKFESILRGGLVASGAWAAADNKGVTGAGPVNVDADEASRFTKHLRSRIAASGTGPAYAKKGRKAPTKQSKKAR